MKNKIVLLLVTVLCAATAFAFDTTGFAKKLPITMSGYAGSSTLTNFPVLVKLSTAIEGFAYADFLGTNGSDLRFVDADGNELPFEIDTWDASGTSFVWVKVPELTASTVITAYYGNASPAAAPAATDVWPGYAGVWHMANDSGITRDSTVNANDATNRANVTAVPSGLIGAAEHMATTKGNSIDNKSGIVVPKSSSLGSALGTQFSVSGWYCLSNSSPNWAYVISEKLADNSAAWGLQFGSDGQTTSFRVYASSSQNSVVCPLTTAGTWVRFDVTYDGATFKYYTNGVLGKAVSAGTVAHASSGLSIGAALGNIFGGVLGDMDEVRIFKTIASADWVKAEYDTVNSSSFALAGAAVDTDHTAPVFTAAPVVAWNGSDWTFSAVLASGVGQLYSIVGSATNAITSGIANPGAYTSTLSGLAADTVYAYAVWATNTLGSIGRKSGTNTFLNGEVSLAAGVDAAEIDLTTPGTFVVSRPAGALATNYDLTVTYVVSNSSTAVAETNYKTLSGSVTIPAGAASATINVYPLRTKTADHTLTLALAGDAYKISTASNSATITIKTLTAPAGTNTWIAAAGTVGYASDANNWSDGVPKVADNILVDGRFSTASMIWDAPSNGLADTVASWTQSADFTGTNMIATTFPEADTAFTNFTVTGAFVLGGGRISHLRQTAATAAIATNFYRLRLTVGGSLTVAAGAYIDVSGKGSYPRGVISPTVGGGYGGASGGSTTVYGESYGNVLEPSDVGFSVRCDGGCTAAEPYAWAGGAAWIEVAGDAILNGAVKSDGFSIWGWNASWGPGGSVYIKAASLSGSGSITANGGGAGGSNNNQCGAGGRISILLTGTDTLGLSTNNITAYGESEYSKQAGCGTIVLRTPSSTNGTLFIKQKSGLYGAYAARPFRLFTTPIPAGQTWAFDSIVFDNAGILRVGPGTTLALPNGLASVAGHSFEGGILLDGGMLDIPNTAETAHVLHNGPWTFQPNSNFVFNGTVTVQGNAAIGAFELSNFTNNYAVCDVSVTGNLTVASDGAIRLVDGGLLSGTVFPATGSGAHGGQPAGSFTNDYAYDSVYRPALPGNGGAQNPGGGVLLLDVSGALTVDGKIDAGTTSGGNFYGAAGSLDIRAGSLSGTGSIKADGAPCSNWSVWYVAVGAGGRVSVRLVGTGATFSDYWTTNITALGVTYYGGDGSRMHSSSAGTVYLQDASQAEGFGTIRIVNNGSKYNNTIAITNVTPFPSSCYGGATETFENASLVVDGLAHVLVTRDFSTTTMEVGSGSSIDLAGSTITVKTLILGDTKVATGVYSATDAAVSSAFTNTSETAGSIIVKGDKGGFVIRICDNDVAVPSGWATAPRPARALALPNPCLFDRVRTDIVLK